MTHKFPLLTAAFVAAALACTPVFAVKESKVADEEDMTELLEMSDQLDKVDKEDFQAAIDRANNCTRARDFSCSESELAKAGKAANGAKDKKLLLAARQSIVGEKARIAEEERRRAEEERRLAEAEKERQRLAMQEEEDRAPSTASQIALFGSLFLDAYKNQLDIKRVDAARARDIDKVLSSKPRNATQQQEQWRAEAAPQRSRAAADQQSRERLAQADTRDRAEQRRLEAERAAEQQRKEREAQQREEQRRKDEQAQRERAQEQQRQREREQAERVAKAQAEKAAVQQAEAAYMTAMRQGIHLVATKCPDGAGHYYVTGKAPNVKGSYCIDVYYQAVCPGSRVRINGMAHNFVGMSGCFGDTYQIDPKPACPVDQVSIEVTDVRQCN